MKNLAFVFSILLMILTGISVSFNNSTNSKKQKIRFISNTKPLQAKKAMARSIASLRKGKIYYKPMILKSRKKSFRSLGSVKKNALNDVKIQ